MTNARALAFLLSSFKLSGYWSLENGVHFPLYGTITYVLLLELLVLCPTQLPTYPEPDSVEYYLALAILRHRNRVIDLAPSYRIYVLMGTTPEC